MNTLDEVMTLGWNMLGDHGLTRSGWTFVIDKRPKNRMGQCRYMPREIAVSAYHAFGDDLDNVRDTIAHEIAHALVGPGHGHDAMWKRMCAVTGANPSRRGHSEVERHFAYRGICHNCGHSYRRHRVAKHLRGNSWCSKCPGRHDGNLLDWVKVDENGTVLGHLTPTGLRRVA